MSVRSKSHLDRAGVVLLIPAIAIVCCSLALFRSSDVTARADGLEPHPLADGAPEAKYVASSDSHVHSGAPTSFELLILEIQESPDYTGELSLRIGRGQQIVPQTFAERWWNSF